MRSLESLYWLGLQLENKSDFTQLPEVKQWEPYEIKATIPVKKALQNLMKYLEKTGKKNCNFLPK